MINFLNIINKIMNSVNLENFCYNYYTNWQSPHDFAEGILIALKILSMVTLIPLALVSLTYCAVVIYNKLTLSEEDKKINEKATEILNTQSHNNDIEPEPSNLFNAWLEDRLKDAEVSKGGCLTEIEFDDRQLNLLRCNENEFLMRLNVELDSDDKELKNKQIQYRVGQSWISFDSNDLTAISLSNLELLSGEKAYLQPLKGKADFLIDEDAISEDIDEDHQLNWFVYSLLSGQSVELEFTFWKEIDRINIPCRFTLAQ